MADEDPAEAPATEKRGGEDVDWDAVRPGEPLPGHLKPGDRIRLHAEGVFSEGTLAEPQPGADPG